MVLPTFPTSRFQSLWLASFVALAACGDFAPEVAPEAQDDGVVDQSALTRPLESGVARRTYGGATQVRSYTLKLTSTAATLAVDLTGKGSVTLKALSPNGMQSCTRDAAVMDHHCSFTSPGTGTWTFDITGVTDFSGSLVVTVDGTGTADAGSTEPVDAGSTEHGPLSNGAAVSDHTTMGMPVVASLTADQILLVKPQYVVSYNSQRKVPNWVSWQLNSGWLGTVSRSSTFYADSQLPSGTPQAFNSDYDGTGYARGHMCPSADRSDTSANNQATFLLTNVVPQAPTLNNGPWKGLENEERQIAASGKTAFVIAGPIFGTTTIGASVSVPVATWKVIVALDSLTPTSASVTEATQVIAVIMPNDTTATKRWTDYRTSVREIEAVTGLNLLSDVATKVQEVIELRVDNSLPL